MPGEGHGQSPCCFSLTWEAPCGGGRHKSAAAGQRFRPGCWRRAQNSCSPKPPLSPPNSSPVRGGRLRERSWGLLCPVGAWMRVSGVPAWLCPLRATLTLWLSLRLQEQSRDQADSFPVWGVPAWESRRSLQSWPGAPDGGPAWLSSLRDCSLSAGYEGLDPFLSTAVGCPLPQPRNTGGGGRGPESQFPQGPSAASVEASHRSSWRGGSDEQDRGKRHKGLPQPPALRGGRNLLTAQPLPPPDPCQQQQQQLLAFIAQPERRLRR